MLLLIDDGKMEDSREINQYHATKIQWELTCLIICCLREKVTVAEGSFRESITKRTSFCYLEWVKCAMRSKTI